jgi:excisionase family DNA binding protein
MEAVQAMNIIGPSEAAKFLNVSRSSIQRWIKAGKLRSFSTAGRHHRIRVQDLKEFASSIGLPPDEIAQASQVTRVNQVAVTFGGILLVDDDPRSLELIESQLATIFPYLEINKASSGFEAGMIAVTALPAVVLVNLAMAGTDGVELCRLIRNNPLFDRVHLAAIMEPSEGGLRARFREAGGDRIFPRPVDKCELCRYISDKLSVVNPVLEECAS